MEEIDVKKDKKIVIILGSMIFLFSFTILLIFVFNVRDYIIKQEFKKAESMAQLVKTGLTAHMVDNTMDKRDFFLKGVQKHSGALKLWIFRSKKVEELYGKGFANESIRDDTDKKVIDTGKMQNVFQDDLHNPALRITIPYIATRDSEPNCLKCHANAKIGDVLGGVSMVFSLSNIRDESILTIVKILIATVLFALIFIYITDKLLKPYVGIIDDIKDLLLHAKNGDYSKRINIKDHKTSQNIGVLMNLFFDRVEATVSSIEKNISTLVADRKTGLADPFEKAQHAINDVALIYKFKRTIENDISKEMIYERLIETFKDQLLLDDLSLYEVHIKEDVRVLIYDDTPDKFCQIADTKTSVHCRAYRTNTIVLSDEFPNICKACETTKEYLCINYTIDENISLVLNIKPKDKKELEKNKKAIGYIRSYLEAAKPVLESKILTAILEKSNHVDGLTGLYNRKYLDNFLEKEVKNYNTFAMAMIDIDYFKKVNDTYGHDVGDRVLKGLSEIFKKCVGEKGEIFRFGGEEFLIFLPDVKTAKDIVTNIKDSFEKKVYEVNGQSFNKTLSAGMSFYKQDSDHVWQVVKNADIALYEAKESGRNRVVLYSDIKDKLAKD